MSRICPGGLLLPSPKLRIDHVKVSAVCNVRNLGTWFDNHLSMKTAINKTCQSELYHLHNIGRIKRFLSFEDRKSIVQAIVMSRIYLAIAYCMVLPLLTLAISNGCKTRQSDWCAHCQDTNTSHRYLYVFTGCRLSLESISRLLCSVSSEFMDTPPII